MPTHVEFAKQVRDALNHLYDYPYLANHALAFHFFPEEGQEGARRAQRLHRLLLESIEELHPATAVHKDPSRVRSYDFLVYRYVEGWNRTEIMRELVLSRRQFFREQQKALMTLTALVLEKAPPSSPETGSGHDMLADEARRILAQREPVHLAEIAQGALAAIQALARQHGVTLEFESAPTLPGIEGNRTLLRQVFLNALSDLITHPGTVRLSLRLYGEPGRLIVELRSEFGLVELDASALPAMGSARRLVEMMGGEWLGAEIGPSTCTHRFAFALNEREPRVLLVVEDNEGVIRAFRRYLAGHSFEVVGATTGPEAMCLARQLQPAAVTLDVMMPTQDGWEILQALKNDPDTQHLPVIVCSALDDPELAQSLGAAAFLHKPVAQTDLFAVLARLPGGLGPSEAGPSRSRRR